MNISRINGWIGRSPTLKRLLVRLVARLPAFDARLRRAVHEAQHMRSAVQVDTAHLPEESRLLFRRLKRHAAQARSR